MKRYLQAGAVVFFFFAGTTLMRQANAPLPTLRAPLGSTETRAVLNAAATYPANDETEFIQGAMPPALTVSAALMKSSIGNHVLYELNPDQHWPLASLTKLMTATVALENLPALGTRDNLIRRMMVISDNDAADALADMMGIEQYVTLMNAKAQTLNMRQTGFSDPSGLSYLNQSTVRDIDKLVTYIIIRHPEIFAWSRLASIRVDGMQRYNINEFARRPDFMGGKTGFTDEANGNLVTILNTASGPMTIIAFGAPTKEDRFIETTILFAWATQHFKL